MISSINFSSASLANRNNNRSQNPSFGAGLHYNIESARAIAKLPSEQIQKILYSAGGIPVNVTEVALLKQNTPFLKGLFRSTDIDVTTSTVSEGFIKKSIRNKKTGIQATFTYGENKIEPQKLEIVDSSSGKVKKVVLDSSQKEQATLKNIQRILGARNVNLNNDEMVLLMQKKPFLKSLLRSKKIDETTSPVASQGCIKKSIRNRETGIQATFTYSENKIRPQRLEIIDSSSGKVKE